MGMSILHKIWSLETQQISSTCCHWKDVLGPEGCINFTCTSSTWTTEFCFVWFLTLWTQDGSLSSLVLFIPIEHWSIGENSWNDLVPVICVTPSNLSFKITLVLSTSAFKINLKMIFWFEDNIFLAKLKRITWWQYLIF